MPKRKHPIKNEHEPHDAVFKSFFGDEIIARNYLLHYTAETVHQQIDFAAFRKIDTAFVSGRFGISFSDVLYETRLMSGAPARLLFLFEHKSFIPKVPIHLQLLDYLLQIWEDDLKNGRQLSFIVPIVVYHGDRQWKQKPFSGYFSDLPEHWRFFIPEFHYLLTDLSRIPPQEIENKVETEYLKNLFLALKFARKKEQILQNWPNILTFGKPDYRNTRAGILLQTLTVYLFTVSDMTDAQIKQLNQQLPEPERDWLDALPEVFGRKWKEKGLREGRKEGLKEGLKEGRLEGREEGRKESALTFVNNLIQNFPDMSDAEIAKLAGVTESFVQAVRREQAEKK